MKNSQSNNSDEKKNLNTSGIGRREFFKESAKVVAILSLARFSLIGDLNAAGVSTDAINPCTGPSNPNYVRGMCDRVSPDCVTQPYVPQE